MDIPTNEPLELRAGDTWAWRREDLSDYPAPTWTLTYKLKREGTAAGYKSITASASSTAHAVSVAKATTAAYAAGMWHWQAYVDDGTSRYMVDSGTLKVLPDFDTAADYDNRSHAKKVLDAIEAVIESRATKDQNSYQIGGRRLDRTPIADLIALRDKYKAEYQREIDAERIAAGLGSKRRILARL